MDERTIKLAEKVDVPLVPSINTFHYSRGERMRQAEKDIRRLRGLGVTYFQIDSLYDRWLRTEETPQ